jgi:hypothetical protein
VHSEKTLQNIDDEVMRIVEEQLNRARRILGDHRDQVEIVTAALLERETIDGEEFKLLMTGQTLPERVLAVDHGVDGVEGVPRVDRTDAEVDGAGEAGPEQPGGAPSA